MAKKFFYLLSYPRCRSTWFSQFFSTNVSYCYHEILSNNDPEAFYKYMKGFHRDYVGSADTNAISFSMAKRENGPMVIINRPEGDVIKSLLKAFEKHEAFTDKEWKQYINNMVEMYSICIEWYAENEENVFVVDFKDLEDEDLLEEIFLHCVPVHKPDRAYIRHMNSLRITIKRKQGMRNGIETSRKNRGFSMEEFKARHLGRYNKEEFKESFWNGPEPQHNQHNGSGLYLGAATMAAL